MTMEIDKRRGNTSDRLSMENFPKNALSSVAAYLEKTPHALLAVALSAPSSSWEKCVWTKEPSRASKIFLSNPYYQRSRSNCPYEDKWENLDLNDVVESLIAKLTDGDICGILVCIDERNNRKRLSPLLCASVQGDELAPLRDSVVLEYIKLSLVYDYTRPIIDPKLLISKNAVVPILQSIIGKDGSSLKYLPLPKIWRVRQRQVLGVFLETYNRVLNNRKLGCSKCGGLCLGTSQMPWVNQQGEEYGLQNFTCHRSSCMEYLCRDFEVGNGFHFYPCYELKYCDECVLVKTCSECHNTTCGGCIDFSSCEMCGKVECEGYNSTFYCDSCHRILCLDCTAEIFYVLTSNQSRLAEFEIGEFTDSDRF